MGGTCAAVWSEPSPGRPLDGTDRALGWAAATWHTWAELAGGSAIVGIARTVSMWQMYSFRCVTAMTCDKCTFRFISSELARFSLPGALCNCVVRRYMQTFKCSNRDLPESRSQTQREKAKPFGIQAPGSSRYRLQAALTAVSPRTDFQGESSFVLSGVLPESTPTSPVAFASLRLVVAVTSRFGCM